MCGCVCVCVCVVGVSKSLWPHMDSSRHARVYRKVLCFGEEAEGIKQHGASEETAGWIDGWMDGWMGGWMDGCKQFNAMLLDHDIFLFYHCRITRPAHAAVVV